MSKLPGRTIDPLVVGRVVGDVIDIFVPTVELTVKYESRQIANGCEIKPAAAVERPLIQLNCGLFSSGSGRASPQDLFTLVMVDPDAPSPSEPTFREWLHWIVVDIPQGMNAASKGKEVVEYMGPKPPTGIHRYVFILFKQNSGPFAGGGTQDQHLLWPDTTNGASRSNFSTRGFAAANNLGLPVAAVYFNAQKQPNSKK